MKPNSKQIADSHGIKIFTSNIIPWDSASALNIPTNMAKKTPKTIDIKNNNNPRFFFFSYLFSFSLARFFGFFQLHVNYWDESKVGPNKLVTLIIDFYTS